MSKKNKDIFEEAGIDINEDTDFETLLSDFLKAFSERLEQENVKADELTKRINENIKQEGNHEPEH